MKMDFHPMGIGFPRIYRVELSWTYFGELPKKGAFYRGVGVILVRALCSSLLLLTFALRSIAER